MTDGRALIAGEAAGEALVLDAPLSFWGGLDPETGRIVDRRHPQHGACVSGRILVMTGGRGSSSSSTILAESIRRGTAPAAIVLRDVDEVIVLGGVVAELLYGITLPIVQLDARRFAMLQDGDRVNVSGTVVSSSRP